MRHRFDEAKLRYERAKRTLSRAIHNDLDLILAPDSGVITQVHVNTLGQVVTEGHALAKMAPADAPIVAETLISGRDIGRIRLGQVARLKYDAFPFDRYGIKRGKLTQISPDATIDAADGPVFRGIIELEHTTISVHNEPKPLMYGMKGNAEIVTDRQTVLNMLLRPLRQLRESTDFASNQDKSDVSRK